MSVTLKLPMTRFVAQVSNGCARSKYAYLAMQQDLEDGLKVCSWREAMAPVSSVTLTVNQLTKTDADKDDNGNWLNQSSYTAYLDDRYDAYKQAGDAIAANATMCGYAGMVAYRLTLPQSYRDNAGSVLSKLHLTVSRDRYCRSGLRLVAVLSDSAQPSYDWDVVRGDGANHGSMRAVLSQSDAAYLLAGRAAESEIEISGDALSTADKYQYLYIYLTLEDYTDYWEDYSVKEKRQYYIEGSGMLIPGRISVEFTGSVTADTVTGISIPVFAPQMTPNPMRMHEMAVGYLCGPDQFGNLNCCTNLFLLCLANRGFFDAKSSDDADTGYSTAERQRVYFREVVNRMLATVRYGSYDFLHRTAALGFTQIDPESGDNYFQADDLNKIAALPASNFDGSYNLLTTDDYEKIGGRYPGYFPLGVWAAPAFITKQLQFDEEGKAPGFYAGVNKHMLAMSYQAYLIPATESVRSKTVFRVFFGAVQDSGLDVSVLCWRSRSRDVYGGFGRAAMNTLASQADFWTGASKKIRGSVSGDGTSSSGIQLSAEAELIGEAIPEYEQTEYVEQGYFVRVSLPAGALEPGDVLILAPKINGLRGDWESRFVNGVSTEPIAMRAGLLRAYGAFNSSSTFISNSSGFGTLFGQLENAQVVDGQLI